MHPEDESPYVHEHETSDAGWFVGIIVALALLAIGYLVFAASAEASLGVCGTTVEAAK